MALVFDNVGKRFSSGREETVALDGVNLSAAPGEFVAIVGPSGCGKSTLLRLAAGLETPSTGTVALDGRPIEGTDPSRGMAFQQPTLFPWLTVEQNVSFGPRMRGDRARLTERVDALLELAGLAEFRGAYPHQLSGGMAQRVALVRTMINEPEVFLLDEPLGALDAFTRMRMQDELLGLWRQLGNTMVMVTHDVDEAIYLATTIVVMTGRPGRVKERIDVGLARPRDRASEEFLRMRGRVLRLLDFGLEGAAEAARACA